jgi:hypothetical protein
MLKFSYYAGIGILLAIAVHEYGLGALALVMGGLVLGYSYHAQHG